MRILVKYFILSVILSITSLMVVSQNKTDQSLAKLNKIYKSGRLLFTPIVIPEIFLNNYDKILDIGTSLIPIDDVKIDYRYMSKPGKSSNLKYHVVFFSCTDGNCIEMLDVGIVSGSGEYFKTKKDCYDFINAYNEIKSLLR